MELPVVFRAIQPLPLQQGDVVGLPCARRVTIMAVRPKEVLDDVVLRHASLRGRAGGGDRLRGAGGAGAVLADDRVQELVVCPADLGVPNG